MDNLATKHNIKRIFVEEAVKNAERLEYIAKLAWMTLQINPQAPHISSELHHRHFSRKHGPDAYYGQKDS